MLSALAPTLRGSLLQQAVPASFQALQTSSYSSKAFTATLFPGDGEQGS